MSRRFETGISRGNAIISGMAIFSTIARGLAKPVSQNAGGKWAFFVLFALFFPLSPVHGQVAGVPYEVKIQMIGEAPPEVRKIMEEVSQTVQKKSDPPQSMALLKRRGEEDLPEMKKVLRSFGFFKNKISLKTSPPREEAAAPSDFPKNPEQMEVHSPQGATFTVPANVLFQVDPGPRFSFGGVSVSLTEDTPKDSPVPPSAAEAGIVEQAPYAAAKVVEAGDYLLTHYKNNGYPISITT